MLSLVSLSKSNFSIRVTCVPLVSLVSHLYCICVACVAVVSLVSRTRVVKQTKSFKNVFKAFIVLNDVTNLMLHNHFFPYENHLKCC